MYSFLNIYRAILLIKYNDIIYLESFQMVLLTVNIQQPDRNFYPELEFVLLKMLWNIFVDTYFG